jgi:hypothetical protein
MGPHGLVSQCRQDQQGCTDHHRKHADVEDIPHITHALYLLTKDGYDLLQVAQQRMLNWKAPA